jgi:2',3'-cyclic-nucleotide 2'-phosphodiesterase (5'-nucleotidase family)
MKQFKSLFFALLAFFLISCKTTSRYRIVEISGTIVEINAAFDACADPEMVAFVDYFRNQLEAEMSVVVGTAAQFMNRARPESLLTNFTSDVMKAFGDEHLPTGADVAVMNVHGHRTAIPAGTITVGILYEVYAFDNTLVFLELKGSDLMRIFDVYAREGGAGVSSNVRLVIGGGEVQSVTIDGQPIDSERIYNIVTVNYLADGNDGMDAFRNAISKTDTGIILRNLIIEHIKEETRQGREINAALDGRITETAPPYAQPHR